MSSCKHDVDIRIVSSDGATDRVSLEDAVAGFQILDELAEPEWNDSAPRVTGAYVHGGAPAGLPTIDEGFLPVRVKVSGSTWAECQAARAALWDAWIAEPVFYLDHEVEGVTTRYQAERSSWRPEPITSTVIARATQEVALVFRVQPFPLSSLDESS